MYLAGTLFRRVLGSSLALAATLSQATGARADDATPASNLAVMGGTALSGAAGIVGVNQSAGIANQQVNVISIGGASVSDDALAATVSQTRAAVPHGSTLDHDRTVIAPGAFAGARGIVQLDQTAGDGNAAINSFALRTRP